MKFCKKCQCETERYANGNCKPCQKAYNAAYRAAHPDKVKARNAANYAANPEKAKVTNAAYRAANRESIAAKGAAYYAANRESIAAYNAANPEARRIREANRRALKKSAGGKLSKDLSAKLFGLQRGKCACCGLELGEDFHLDHIMPLAKGGSNTDDNIQLLRGVCNHQKSAKDPIEFMQSRGKLL